ncbi:MAG: hypothetical protein JOZ02_21330 [Acidobacteria bacterium]|nr:hypothetical protein [Acidobacteriota bacterium]
MYERLKERIHAGEPELLLISYDDAHRATFRLRDCDGYDLGTLVCLGVRLMCLATQRESFDRLDVFPGSELPAGFSWLSREGMEEAKLFVFTAIGDYEDLSLLPVIDGRRVGYLVCDSLEFQPPEA